MDEKKYPTVILYGFADASASYACVRYEPLYEGEDDIPAIKYEATMMKRRNPSIIEVYAVAQRKRLASDYNEAIRKHTVESFVIFKRMIEQEGLRVN